MVLWLVIILFNDERSIYISNTSYEISSQEKLDDVLLNIHSEIIKTKILYEVLHGKQHNTSRYII